MPADEASRATRQPTAVAPTAEPAGTDAPAEAAARTAAPSTGSPLPAPSAHPAGARRDAASAPTSAAIEAWLADLGLEPAARADRDGAAAWDLVLDGRRRRDLRLTVILEPGLAVVVWAQFAPPIGDGFRKSYRRLLLWNDDFPFAKFGLTEDERPVLSIELPPGGLTADDLGLALARAVGIADRLLDETAGWLWIGGRMPAGYLDRPGRNPAFLARYAARLPELFDR